MKNSKLVNKFKKILITVLCIITVFFSMPVKAKADAGVLESVASFLLLVPDGIQLLLNTFVSDETEDVKFLIRLQVIDKNANLFTNDTGSLYNIEVTPYDIFTSGTPTLYGELIEKRDEINYSVQNGEMTTADAVATIKENVESTEPEAFMTKSLVKMPLLDANFFKKTTNSSSSSDEQVNSADVLRPVVANVYKNLRNFVLIIMLAILLYTGIRIIVSSAVSEQVKYKQYLVNWVVGICLIFLMQYIMSAIMNVTTIVNKMLITNTDGESYRIGFGTKDSKAASVFRTIAKPYNMSEKEQAQRDAYEKSLESPPTSVKLSDDFQYNNPNLATQYLSAWLNKKANDENKNNGDGWTELANSDDEKISNFVNRKIEIADNGAIFIFDKDNKTVYDYTADISQTPIKINAGIYDGSVNGFRAIYKCNIAEFCRTITTFSSKYTHLYNNKKTMIMTDSSEEKDNDYAVGAFWGYAFLYILITIETVVFLYKYLKRVIWLAFLTMIAPLIAVMYSVDKIGDGKAQTFNMWFKEYLFNSLIQPLHLLLYTIFLGASMELMASNVIYAIVAYAFMIPAEKFFKKMFGFDKASTPGGLGSPAAGMMAMRGLDKLGGFGPHGKGAKGGKDAGKTKIPLAKGKLGGGGLAPAGPTGAAGAAGATPLTAARTGAGGATAGAAAGSAATGSASAAAGAGTAGGSRRLRSAGGISSGTAGKARRRGSSSVLGGMGRALGNRTAMRITGGKSATLGQAFTTRAGLAGMAKNGFNFAARQIGRTAGGIGGSLIGLGVGAVSGALGTALTGEDKFSDAVQKGLLAGSAAGANRGTQFTDWSTGGVEDLYGEGRRYAAIDPEDEKQLERAARLKAEDWSQEHMSEVSTLSADKYKEKMDFAEEAFKYTDDIEDLDQLERMQGYSTDASGKIDEDKFAEAIDYEKITKRFGDFNVDAKKKDNYTTYRAREIADGFKNGTIQFNQTEMTKINGATTEADKEKFIKEIAKEYATNEADIIARYQDG